MYSSIFGKGHIGSLMTVGYVRCSVNPRAGREAALKEAPACDGGGRKIAVVGGGCAGMEAAAVLGSRGFDVTLYEKDQTLGGELKLAGAAAPYKDKVAWLIVTLESEMEEAGVKVRTGVPADSAMIRETGPKPSSSAQGQGLYAWIFRESKVKK